MLNFLERKKKTTTNPSQKRSFKIFFKRTDLFSWYVCLIERPSSCYIVSVVHMCIWTISTHCCRRRFMELLPIPLPPYRGTCNTVLPFWSSVFYCPFPGLPTVCYIWIEVPFFSWAPMTKSFVRSSGRGTQLQGQLARGVSAGAAGIP